MTARGGTARSDTTKGGTTARILLLFKLFLNLVEAAKIYERAAEMFEKKWNAHGNIGGFIDWLGFKINIMLLLSPHACRRLRLRFPRSMLETDSDSALNDLIAAPFLAAVFALHSRPML